MVLLIFPNPNPNISLRSEYINYLNVFLSIHSFHILQIIILIKRIIEGYAYSLPLAPNLQQMRFPCGKKRNRKDSQYPRRDYIDNAL